MLIQQSFSIENQKPFAGYYQPTDQWNGWARPYFEWEIATEIAEWTNAWSGGERKFEIDAQRRVIIDLEDPGAPFEISAEPFQTELGEKLLYGVGTGWWIWDVHETG